MDEAQPSQELKPGMGHDLRALRRLRRMTLSDLAAATGRSVGFLSRVERGLSTISVEDLRRVTNVLEVPLGWFFINEPAPPAERGYIVRAQARRQVGDRDDGLIEELLSPDIGGTFEVFRSAFEPGAEMAEPSRRQTEEAGYLVQGELELWLEGQHFHLYPGDSFRFSGESYRWRNPGGVQTVIIWVIAPPVY